MLRVWIYKIKVSETYRHKNNFLSLFLLFTGDYTGSVNSLLGTSIKPGLCLLGSYYTVEEGNVWKQELPQHPIMSSLPDSVLIWCFFCNVSAPSLAQLCHFFLSSRNTIGDITSSLWSAKLHVFVCAGQMIQPHRISWKYFCLNNLIPAALKISSTLSVVLRSASVRFGHQLQSFQSDWQHSAGRVFRS